LETIGNTRLLAVTNVKMTNVLTTIIKLVIIYSSERIVYSAKQSPSGKKEPWTITTVHTNGTIRIQCGTKSERINIRRVTPFSEELLI
jgi:hypothetical protein